MREFKKHRGQKEELARLIFRGAGVLLLFVLTVVLLRAAWGMYVKMVAASQGQEEATAALARAEAQQQGVSGSLSQLGSQRGEEALIRERFGVAKPGEGEIDIVHQAPAASSTSEAGESWWQRILHAMIVW